MLLAPVEEPKLKLKPFFVLVDPDVFEFDCAPKRPFEFCCLAPKIEVVDVVVFRVKLEDIFSERGFADCFPKENAVANAFCPVLPEIEADKGNVVEVSTRLPDPSSCNSPQCSIFTFVSIDGLPARSNLVLFNIDAITS